MLTATLCLFAFIAGLLDAMVGGGGLIQLPALLVVLPSVPHPVLFGTNKLASLVGTFVAVIRFAKSVTIPWYSIFWGAIAAFVTSFLGARCVSFTDPAVLKPLIVIVLVAMVLYTVKRKDFGAIYHPLADEAKRRRRAALLGAAVGFYDGFFGPGTGTFFVVGLIALCGLDFLRASASAKLMNLGTNVAAYCYFAARGEVMYDLALPMAAANAAGAAVGARLAIAKGSVFVRGVFVFVCFGLVLKLVWDMVAT